MSSLPDVLDADGFVTLSGGGSSLLHLPPGLPPTLRLQRGNPAPFTEQDLSAIAKVIHCRGCNILEGG